MFAPGEAESNLPFHKYRIINYQFNPSLKAALLLIFSGLSLKHVRLNFKRDIQLEFTLGWKVRGLNYERE
jgi:hypothetical protein